MHIRISLFTERLFSGTRIIYTWGIFLSFFFITAFCSSTQAAVRLVAIRAGLTSQEIQTILNTERNVYFGPGTHMLGTLQISNRNQGIIWGAGRMTTTLVGRIVISGSTITLGNLTFKNPDLVAGQALIDITGPTSNISVVNVAAYAGTLFYPDGINVALKNGGTAIRMRAPGDLTIQGTHFGASDLGLSIENALAHVTVLGGNFQANRLHILEMQGQMEVRAFGAQMAFGGADIEIRSASASGFHVIEGVRSEGNNNARLPEHTFLRVPLTSQAVNVAIRSTSLMGFNRYAEYNANGTLALIANANYPQNTQVASITANGSAKIISYGTHFGYSYDVGPFQLGPQVSMVSTGDLWHLLNKDDYSRPFTEPLSVAAFQAAGKTVPAGLTFTAENGTATALIPIIPRFRTISFPVISNLSALMMNVINYGARPDDGVDDYAAIQKAITEATATNGISQPLFFPAGRYQLSQPLTLEHGSGGGFWGVGQDKTVLISTSGQGVLRTDGAGYATFVDIAFENKTGATSTTVDFGWRTLNSLRYPSTGAALQGNMFYRTRFEHGGVGLAIGTMGDGSPNPGMMGSEFMIVESIFRNQHRTDGTGSNVHIANYNALTNSFVNSQFDNADWALTQSAGSFTFYGDQLTKLTSGGINTLNSVADAFPIIDVTMDSSPGVLIRGSHSSSLKRILIAGTTLQPPISGDGKVSEYNEGGSVVAIDFVFPGRYLANGGAIGDNTLIVNQSVGGSAYISGRAHKYYFK
ncbi:MAG: glycosyl hydrolase family 28-related protein [Chitinophagaceae bacterium]